MRKCSDFKRYNNQTQNRETLLSLFHRKHIPVPLKIKLMSTMKNVLRVANGKNEKRDFVLLSPNTKT